MRAKKSYGQHFLINESLCQNIVQDFGENINCKNVVEVGPGRGAITKYLLNLDINYKAIEADRDMIAILGDMFPNRIDSFIENNFLKFDFSSLFDGQEFNVVGNFPYNISSQILFKIMDQRNYVPLTYGMFQKEVADRIVAPSGNKTYGILSVIFQSFYECSITRKISPGSFRPPPKVNSAMVLMKRKSNFTLPCDEKLFYTVVKSSFNQRRKMLRNSLKGIVGDDPMLSEKIYTQRPEQLAIEDFYHITNKIGEKNESRR